MDEFDCQQFMHSSSEDEYMNPIDDRGLRDRLWDLVDNPYPGDDEANRG